MRPRQQRVEIFTKNELIDSQSVPHTDQLIDPFVQRRVQYDRIQEFQNDAVGR